MVPKSRSTVSPQNPFPRYHFCRLLLIGFDTLGTYGSLIGLLCHVVFRYTDYRDLPKVPESVVPNVPNSRKEVQDCRTTKRTVPKEYSSVLLDSCRGSSVGRLFTPGVRASVFLDLRRLPDLLEPSPKKETRRSFP